MNSPLFAWFHTFYSFCYVLTTCVKGDDNLPIFQNFLFFQLFGNNLVSASYDCTVVVSRLPEGLMQENNELLQENNCLLQKNNNLLEGNNELSQNGGILQEDNNLLQDNNELSQKNKSLDVQKENTPLSSNPLTKCFTEEDVRQVSKVQVEKYFLKLEIIVPTPGSLESCFLMFH